MTALSLFAGIGATAKGLRDIVGEDVVALEKVDTMVATLRSNKFFTIQDDVKEVDWHALGREIGPVRIITGGPPCQPFSQAASNGTGQYDPRDCIPDFIEAVRVLQPEVFLMEEVKTLTWAKHRVYFSKVLDDLVRAGYHVAYRVLDMSKYGVPQARKRLFVVGVRNDLQREVRWPQEKPAPTMAQALEWDKDTAYAAAMAAPVFGDYEWVFERPSTTVVGSYRPEIQAAPGYRVSKEHGSRQNAPGSVYITLDEALVLQGLPRDWKIAGNVAKQRLQIGNACPPQMTAAIIQANL